MSGTQGVNGQSSAPSSGTTSSPRNAIFEQAIAAAPAAATGGSGSPSRKPLDKVYPLVQPAFITSSVNWVSDRMKNDVDRYLAMGSQSAGVALKRSVKDVSDQLYKQIAGIVGQDRMETILYSKDKAEVKKALDSLEPNVANALEAWQKMHTFLEENHMFEEQDPVGQDYATGAKGIKLASETIKIFQANGFARI